ncbi:MAG: hypothetical protein K1V80_07830 [Muribaculaceae bacterium]
MTSAKDVCKYRNRGMYDRREDMPGRHSTTKWHPEEAVYICNHTCIIGFLRMPYPFLIRLPGMPALQLHLRACIPGY